ncbi:hypothetical protein D3C73_1260560 [compost metagenome]
MLGLELARLEFDDHIAAQLEVIEQQVDEELVTTNIQQHLLADEGKACAQFQQELGDMLDQSVFDLTLLRIKRQAEEVEAVRIFQRLAGQVGLRFRQVALEVTDCLAAALQ